MIVISDEDFRHVVDATAEYKIGHQRIEDTVLCLADHIRNERRHRVDSLMCGSRFAWRADEAMFKELIAQVLVAVAITLENKGDIKQKMIEEATCDARNTACAAFDKDKQRLVSEGRDKWLEFNRWYDAHRKAEAAVADEFAKAEAKKKGGRKHR